MSFLSKIYAKTQELNMLNTEAIYDWLEKNSQDSLDNDKDLLDELITKYQDKFREVQRKTSILIYRAIKLKSVKDLNYKRLGMHWSFEESGAQVCGGGDYMGKEEHNGKTYTLVGETHPNNVDWEYGLISFLGYGEDQWECALKSGSKVNIKAIKDSKKILENPNKIGTV